MTPQCGSVTGASPCVVPAAVTPAHALRQSAGGTSFACRPLLALLLPLLLLLPPPHRSTRAHARTHSPTRDGRTPSRPRTPSRALSVCVRIAPLAPRPLQPQFPELPPYHTTNNAPHGVAVVVSVVAVVTPPRCLLLRVCGAPAPRAACASECAPPLASLLRPALCVGSGIERAPEGCSCW